jgi:anti-anti-sigma factor
MAFNLTDTTQDGVVYLTLAGSLDASSAPTLQGKVQEAVKERVTRLVLHVKDLEYISSAGLRAILFAKQKLGSGADIYVIAPQEQVSHTLQISGFDQAVIIQEVYSPVEKN